MLLLEHANGHTPRVYSTNTEYLLISTRTGLTSGSDLSTGSLTDTHTLLTTDGETNYNTGGNQTLVASFTTDSDGNPINTGTPITDLNYCFAAILIVPSPKFLLTARASFRDKSSKHQ